MAGRADHRARHRQRHHDDHRGGHHCGAAAGHRQYPRNGALGRDEPVGGSVDRGGRGVGDLVLRVRGTGAAQDSSELRQAPGGPAHDAGPEHAPAVQAQHGRCDSADFRIELAGVPGDDRAILRQQPEPQCHPADLAKDRRHPQLWAAAARRAVRGADHRLRLFLCRAGIRRPRHGGEPEEGRCLHSGYSPRPADGRVSGQGADPPDPVGRSLHHGRVSAAGNHSHGEPEHSVPVRGHFFVDYRRRCHGFRRSGVVAHDVAPI